MPLARTGPHCARWRHGRRSKRNMSQTLLLSLLLLSWLAIAALGLCVLALARQIGVLHERVAPVGALSMSKGPAVGQPVPRLTARTLEGREVVLGAPRSGGRRLLLL